MVRRGSEGGEKGWGRSVNRGVRVVRRKGCEWM